MEKKKFREAFEQRSGDNKNVVEEIQRSDGFLDQVSGSQTVFHRSFSRKEYKEQREWGSINTQASCSCPPFYAEQLPSPVHTMGFCCEKKKGLLSH